MSPINFLRMCLVWVVLFGGGCSGGATGGSNGDAEKGGKAIEGGAGSNNQGGISGSHTGGEIGNNGAGATGARATSGSGGPSGAFGGKGGSTAAATVATGGSAGSAGASANGGISPVLVECAVFPPDNPWNSRVDDKSFFPTDPNSSAILQNISDHATRDSEHFLHADFGSAFGIPYLVVPESQMPVGITIKDAPEESDSGPFPIPENAPVEEGSDAHVLVLQKGTCLLYELYGASFSQCVWSCSSAAKFDLRTNDIRSIAGQSCPTSADAAGLPIMPGLVKYEEVASGRITHAVRFTVRATRRAFLRPATHYASSYTDPSFPPMGMRVRLRAVPAGITGQSLVVATALKEYGMILADNGSNWFISGAPDPNFNDEDLDQLKSISESELEVVEMGVTSQTSENRKK
jgi:hypothetical protein